MTSASITKTVVYAIMAVAIIVGSGVLHGHMNQRWGAAEQLELAAKEVNQFPSSFAAWQMTEEQPLSDTAIELLRCEGYFHRTYTHRTTGMTVDATLIVGPGSTMAIHTPEICFSSSNYVLTRDRHVVSVEDGADSHAFWSVDFQTNDAQQQPLRVYYAWSAGDGWHAPEYPRFAFAGKPVLHKLQVTVKGVDEREFDENSAGHRFIRDFLAMFPH